MERGPCAFARASSRRQLVDVRIQNMQSLWMDTDPETEAEMLRLLRRASVAKRFALADALTNSVVSLSRRALAKIRPQATEREILLEWVGLHYGSGLERELRNFFTNARSV